MKEARDHLPVVISEFGCESDDDVVQRDAYSDIISFFGNLGVKRCIAWMWRADYDLGNPDVPGTGFNLADNVMGVPRPAFYELLR